MDSTTLLMSGGMVIGLIAAIALMAWRAKKRNLTVGELFNELFMREGASIIIGLLVSLNLIEAITAASVHRIGNEDAAKIIINPVTRFTMHFLLGMAGAFFAIYATKALLDFLKSLSAKNRKEKPLLFLIELLLFLITAPLSFVLPYINVFIISVATDETQMFKLACYQWYKFWLTNEQLGIRDPNYSAISNMSVVMTTSFFAMFAHYLISIVDGIIALRERYVFGLDDADNARKEKAYADRNGTGKGKDADKPKEKKEEKDKEKDKNKDNLKFIKVLLDFLNVSATNQAEYTKKCNVVIADGTDKPRQAKLFNSLSKLNTDVENFTKSNEDAETRQRKRDEIRSDIKSFFASTPENGGFGFDPVP